MKIVHVCLTGSYNDNWGYQDNLIPKYHSKFGHDVTVITNRFVNSKIDDNYELVNQGRYQLDNGVKIIRLPFLSKLPLFINKKARIYEGLLDELININPDFIFIHGVQFLDIFEVIKFLELENDTKVVVDNHADFSNSATNWLSKNILHKIIWKKCAKMIEPYTDKFYGVLPARVDFLVDMYDIPREKVELLVMGADNDEIDRVQESNSRVEIRGKYGIQEDDFLIVTGGKIDSNKPEVLNLMRAIKSIDNQEVVLAIFGSVTSELKEEFERLVINENIHYAGWIKSNESYDYFEAADLVVFPGLHSVFWEQVAGQGIPMLVKNIGDIEHLDLGGNLRFLDTSSTEEIKKELLRIIQDENQYSQMLDTAQSKKRKKLLYSEIAKKSIEC